MLINHEILKSAGMWLRDPLTGMEGYTLAAVMLFGTENTIRSVAPFYKIDALCRIYNTDLYDNRDMMNCNLLRALDRLTGFCERNLPEWPYIEGIQRKSLRDIIFREVCLNLLIHSEYGSRHSSTFTIWNDRVEVVNWNIPYGYGKVTLENFRPYAKNPVIANFFLQLGAVDEVGKGTRTLFKYVPLVSGGQEPIIEEMNRKIHEAHYRLDGDPELDKQPAEYGAEFTLLDFLDVPSKINSLCEWSVLSYIDEEHPDGTEDYSVYLNDVTKEADEYIVKVKSSVNECQDTYYDEEWWDWCERMVSLYGCKVILHRKSGVYESDIHDEETRLFHLDGDSVKQSMLDTFPYATPTPTPSDDDDVPF